MRLLTLKTIVVATDLDPSSHAALESAHRLAAAAGAALHVLHVVAPRDGADPGGRILEQAADAVRAALATVKVPVGDAGIHVIAGPVADTIRSFADRMSADVVVLGPHRQRDRVTGGHLLGGTARAVAERAYAPCLVAAQPIRLPLERVLVPTDLSDTARGALLVGLSWASGLRMGGASERVTSLTALQVLTPAEAADAATTPDALDRELATLHAGRASWAGIDVEGRAERGEDVAATIDHYAADHEADLIVIGTRGRGADEVARLGSVSASMTTRLKTPVLLVPPGVWRVHAGAGHVPPAK